LALVLFVLLVRLAELRLLLARRFAVALRFWSRL
jgi:hypothetical protein